MKVLHVVGARPNFMKAAPVIEALRLREGVEQVLVHTGQHYDSNMSDVFFRQLGMPEPDVNLEVGSDTHARQTAATMVKLEEQLLSRNPDLVVVYGDINSTVAAALVASKLGIDVAHVEAGLRSFDRTMPEEINRILTDRVSTLLFTPSIDGNENLVAEGVSPAQIHFVGNVMIDTLVRFLPDTEQRWDAMAPSLSLRRGEYGVVTLHRPSNVDEPESLRSLMKGLSDVSDKEGIPLVFPMHPRTRNKLETLNIQPDGIRILEPVGYVDFLTLQRFARYVITDSGGIQEETTYLRVPCFTMRNNTERPVTITEGTNQLVGDGIYELLPTIERSRLKDGPRDRMPLLWDGRASGRIAEIVAARDW